MKLLVIPSWYPTDVDPISGIFFKEQADELAKKINIAVLHICEPIKIYELNKIIKKCSTLKIENRITVLQYQYINWIPLSNRIKIFLYQRAVKKAYSQLIRVFGSPDIIHAQSTLMGGYGAILIAQSNNLPVIVSEHASFFEKFFSDSRSKIAKEVLKKADLFSGVSTSLCKTICDKGRHDCIVIPNFINKNKFNNPLSHINGENKKFKLLYVGNLIFIKGVDNLLKSLNFVVYKYHYVNIHLDIVGDGPEKDKYQKLAQKLNLNNYCTFHGKKSPEELSDFYNQASALIISSRSETFCIAGIEAMSVGIPIVTTKCGGPEDYINPNNGILVDNHSPEKLAEGIISLIDNYDLFIPEIIRNNFIENYSSDVMVDNWIEIYNELMKKYSEKNKKYKGE